jgi:hypothetical protein
MHHLYLFSLHVAQIFPLAPLMSQLLLPKVDRLLRLGLIESIDNFIVPLLDKGSLHLVKL